MNILSGFSLKLSIATFVWLVASVQLGNCQQNDFNAEPAGQTDKTKPGSKVDDVCNVDLYTGSLSVNIPLYDYQVDGLSLGVSINYDARGIKVDQMATPVGLGWDINAGGSIERMSVGIEDECSYPNNDFNQGLPGNQDDHDWVNGAWVGSDGSVGNVNGIIQPDLFIANIAGRTVKFSAKNYDNTSQLIFKVYPKCEIKIEAYIYVSGASGLNGPLVTYNSLQANRCGIEENNYIYFKITDEYGNQYWYDRGEYSKTVIEMSNGNVDYYSTNKWVLAKVKTYSGQEISYEYNKSQVGGIPIAVNETAIEMPSGNHSATNAAHSGYLSLNKKVVELSGQVAVLSKIAYPNKTEVVFTLGNTRCDMLYGGKVIENITVKQRYGINDEHSTSYKLNYAYFKAYNAAEVAYGADCNDYGSLGYSSADDMMKSLRLKLKSIDRVNEAGTEARRYYAMTYNSSPLPSRLSPSKDHFGYYNGAQPSYGCFGADCSPVHQALWGNSSLPLHMSQTFKHVTTTNGQTQISNPIQVMYGVVKTPSFSHKTASILTELTNENGGKIYLQYKDHSLTNPSVAAWVNRPTGATGENANDGICIDKIQYADPYTAQSSFSYEYVFSNGERYHNGGYYWYKKFVAYLPDLVVYKNFCVNNFTYPRGSNHGYGVVEVIKRNSSLQQLSRLVYKFSNVLGSQAGQHNVEYGPSPIIPDYKTARVPRVFEFKMGNLLEKEYYDHTNTILTKSVYNYVTKNSGNPGSSLDNGPDWSFKDFSDVPTSYGGTHFYYNANVVGSENITRYFPNGQSTKQINYQYDDKDNVKVISWLDSYGRQIKDRIYYYHDLYGPTREQFQLAKSRWLIDGSSNEFLLHATVQWMDGIVGRWRRFGTAKPANPMITQTIPGDNAIVDALAGTGTPSQELKDAVLEEVRNMLFDPRGNVLEIKNNESESYSVRLWDMRIGQKVAEITNARFNEVAYTSFEGTHAPNPINPQDIDYNKGNWLFDANSIVRVPTGTGMQYSATGKYYHNGNSPITSRINTIAGKGYLVSFWASGGAGTPIVETNVVSWSITAQRNAGIWTLYKVVVPGSGQPVIVRPSVGQKIDELRMIPVGAAITTWCYDPLFGVNTASNEINDATYYEYDGFGQLKTTRDIMGNVLLHTETGVQSQDN